MRMLVATIAAGLLTANGAQTSLKGGEFLPRAKISLEDARATALRARPGEITDEELETEKGGSGLRFSFDIKSRSRTYEVGVDAKTGKVLENSTESAHPD